MVLKPVGVIHSPYKEKRDAPRQGRRSGEEITLEISTEMSHAVE